MVMQAHRQASDKVAASTQQLASTDIVQTAVMQQLQTVSNCTDVAHEKISALQDDSEFKVCAVCACLCGHACTSFPIALRFVRGH